MASEGTPITVDAAGRSVSPPDDPTRREFLKGGLTGIAAISLTGLPTLAAADCVATGGELAGSRQRTLEALCNVLLPGAGTHGSSGDGVLQATLYGKKLYQHLVDPYYAAQVSQSDLTAAVTDLSNGSFCMEGTTAFWQLGCGDQLGLAAYGSRRSDEGPAPNVDWWEALCLAFGQLFAPTVSDPGKAYDLSRFCAFVFYGSPQGFAYLKPYGYPGPNWGFDGNDWSPLGPALWDDLDLEDLTCSACSEDAGPYPPSIHPATLAR